MSGRAWVVLLVVLSALGFVTWLFAVQNSGRTVILSLDLGFAAWQTAQALPVPALIGGSFGVGFLVAMVLVLPRMAAQGRKVRALERQVAINAPAAGPQDPWRSNLVRPPGSAVSGGRVSANRGRIAAARTLLAVEEGEHAEEVLAKTAPPKGPDRSLAWFLALGVLRRRSHVDAALRPCLRQPLSSLDPEVRAVLRVGAFEILFARTPIHAAVDQGVEVARSVGAPKAAGLVNAVLRRVREATGLGRADELDHPPWVVARWDERYGPAATTAWCQRNNEPAVVFAVEREAGIEATWREAGLEVEPVTLHGRPLPGVWRLPKAGAVTDLPGFAEGRFWVQDAASVAVADLVGAGQGTRVLDACAAPGGKTFRLLSQGARVTAVDVDQRRIALLAESARRLRFDVAPVVHDWVGGGLRGAGTFDAVLVDAPCTALGLVRRHPEIRWRRQLIDVRAMPERQGVILTAASTHVKPGGRLVYAVCSPEPEEGPLVVDMFLAANPGFEVETTLSTAPPEGDEDAFYAAALTRTA